MGIDTIKPARRDAAKVRAVSVALRSGATSLLASDGTKLAIPRALRRVLEDAADCLQDGRAFSLVPSNEQLTTQRAAELLGVSRPHLIKLLESGEMPYHKAGSHRRIYWTDLESYRRRRDAARGAALGRLAREAFALGLYDATGIPDGGTD